MDNLGPNLDGKGEGLALLGRAGLLEQVTGGVDAERLEAGLVLGTEAGELANGPVTSLGGGHAG